MKVSEVIEAVKSQLSEITQLKLNTIAGIKKEGEGWCVTVELVEKKSIPDGMDLLGIYDVMVNKNGEIVNFERKGMRKRGDTGITSHNP